MIGKETIKQLQSTSIEDRLHLMEVLLDSLKRDIKNSDDDEEIRPEPKKFIVRTFNLGQDIQAERDVIYAERGF